MQGPLAIARQGSFFVGERDVYSDTLAVRAGFEPSGTSLNKIFK